MAALGIVFLYDRGQGPPEEVSKDFAENFPLITGNLDRKELLTSPEVKTIIDNSETSIFWAGIKQNFKELLQDNEMIGNLAVQVFNNHTGKEPSEDVKSLIYDGKLSPWKFDLIVCVLSE